MIIYVFLVAKTTCKGAITESEMNGTRLTLPLVATPLGTKENPLQTLAL